MRAGAWNVTANASGIVRRSDRLAAALALSRVNSSIGCALIWALLFAATCTLAQMPPSVHHAIDVYRNAIAEAESAATPHGIESAFAAIQDLREVLFADVPGGTLSVLDSLPEADFALLEQLPGVRVRRIEVLVVHPDADFYVELSEQVGDEADLRVWRCGVGCRGVRAHCSGADSSGPDPRGGRRTIGCAPRGTVQHALWLHFRMIVAFRYSCPQGVV